MKIPRINKIPLSHIKGQGCKILERISGRLFVTTSSGHVPERRTIQSMQISTISSLVDHNKVSSGSQLEKQTDTRHNYEFRSNCRNEITLNVQPLSSISPAAASQSTDIYHEKFLPCSRQEFRPPSVPHQYHTHDQHIASINVDKEFDCGSLKHLDMPSTKSEHRENVPPTKIAPPPRRKKLPSAPVRLIQQNTQELRVVDKKVALTKSSKPKHHAPQPPIRSLQPNKLLKNVDNSDKRKQSIQSSTEFYEQTTSELNIDKNVSELYRIADSVDSDAVLTINSPILTGVAKLKKNRKSALKHVRSTESLNIFEPINNDAFSDFIDELSFEPVVSVLHDKSCDTTLCSRNLILNSKNAETIQNINLNGDSGLAGMATTPWISNKMETKQTTSFNSFDSNHSVVCIESAPPELPTSSFTRPTSVRSSVVRTFSTVTDPLILGNSINNVQPPRQRSTDKADSITSVYIKENSSYSVPGVNEVLNTSSNHSNNNNENTSISNDLKLSNRSIYDDIECSRKIHITTRSVYIMNLFTV